MKDGLSKRCACVEPETCHHSWHFDFYKGKKFRYSLNILATARGEAWPLTREAAATLASRVRREICAGTFVQPNDIQPVDVPEPAPERKRLGNPAALAVAQELVSLGCRVWLKGWPDLLIQHKETGAVVAAEVKFGTDVLSVEQGEVIDLLRQTGMIVFEVRDRVTGPVVRFFQEHQDAETQTHAGTKIPKLILANDLYRLVRDLGGLGDPASV